MFSVKNDDPFVIFRKLQDIARREAGDAEVIDLSRGDPGYGFVPSRRGREFASYVLWLDSVLNASAKNRFATLAPGFSPGSEEAPTPPAAEFIPQRIAETTMTTFQPEITSRLLGLLREFIDTAITAAEGEDKQWNAADVLRGLFGNCAMSGGSYLDPKGQELTRIIVAAWHRKEYGVNVTSEDLILTSGASHAIGTVFKALGEEGCGFLQRGDTVAIASPVYAPYNRILEERGIRAVALHEKAKTLVLIDPNNPTGFSLSPEDIAELATIAKKCGMLVITDEVYSSFFPSFDSAQGKKKKTMLALAPERTICINARSKIERSTGLRFGEIITLPEGRRRMATMLGLTDAAAFERLLIFAKAPGRAGGQFQHTTFVPGPSQLLGIAHIVLGAREREAYLRELTENMRVFCEELSIPHRGNQYYLIFDLNGIPGCATRNEPMESRLTRLAQAGVIYIPAYRFFSEDDRGSPGALTSVRASVVNTTPERLKEAARRTREVLC